MSLFDDRPRAIVVYGVDGSRREFTPDGDGLMWRYETPDGPRWIGWRALALQIEATLEHRALGRNRPWPVPRPGAPSFGAGGP